MPKSKNIEAAIQQYSGRHPKEQWPETIPPKVIFGPSVYITVTSQIEVILEILELL